MRLDFFMLADGASVAAGKLYVHGGAITRISPPTLPSAPVILSLVARFLIDEPDFGGPPVDVLIEWQRPNRTELFPPITTQIQADAPSEAFREGEDQGTVILVNALVGFDEPGPHHVVLHLGGDVVAERRLFVAPQDGPDEATR
jgi:hypothetical protein